LNFIEICATQHQIAVVMPAGDNEKDTFIQRRSYFESIFGNLKKLTDSDKNPDALMRHLIG
jgi:hypothetical protein